MTQSRQTQVSLEATPFYHCTVRCVRRAFLCGNDHTSGRNFDHRKQWLVSRMRFLSYVYAIDLCAYAVLDNHYHAVVHVDAKRAAGWSDEEVVERWQQLYKPHVLVDRWRAGSDQTRAERETVGEIIAQWRERLCDLSWFMRGLNETIARMANAEDACTGRFWEGRFKSQALLDEGALLSCMAYVDLNPIRAGMEQDLGSSDFTSIQRRLHDYVREPSPESTPSTRTPVEIDRKTEQEITNRVESQQRIERDLGLDQLPQSPLMPFSGSAHTPIDEALPFTREDYFDLLDMTGRAIRDDKRGFIPQDLPPIVQRLGIDPEQWLEHVQSYTDRYGACAGSVEKLRAFAHAMGRCWSKGVKVSKRCYRTAAA